MDTVKLYYENAYTQDFTAVVESCEAVKNGVAVPLARTAFYPEGGGQPADHGTLGEARVLDVHEKDKCDIFYADRTEYFLQLIHRNGSGVRSSGQLNTCDISVQTKSCILIPSLL